MIRITIDRADRRDVAVLPAQLAAGEAQEASGLVTRDGLLLDLIAALGTTGMDLRPGDRFRISGWGE